MQISAQFDSNDLLRRFEQRRNTAQVWLDSEILRSRLCRWIREI